LRDDALDGELSKMQKAAARALAEYDAMSPQKVIKPLVEGLEAARKAREKLSALPDDANAKADADFLLDQKEKELTDALLRASGVTVEALSDAETVAPGESVQVALKVFVPDASLVQVGEMKLRAPEGWRFEPVTAPQPASGPFAIFRRETAQQSAFFRLNVPANAPITQPYWLTQPRTGDIFQWPTDAPKGLPFGPPQAFGEVRLEIGGVPVSMTKAIQYRYADPVRGEIRRDLNVVPALSVALDSNLIIVPAALKNQTRRIAVRLTNNSQQAINGQVHLRLPAGWTAQPAQAPFEIKEKNARTALIFNVLVPARTKDGAFQIDAEATASGQTFNREMDAIEFPHIQTHRIYPLAEATVRVLNLQVADVRVGYIMGSGDEVPEAIERMGVPVTMLDENELSTGDLSRFDTIVVGVRAAQVRPDFVANNNRLLEFMQRGGTLIVQYERPDYVARNLMPFPAQMDPRETVRVTDEKAPVNILQPQHPVFNYPNQIVPEDWANWVQERTLYDFASFDPKYVPLLESHDEGEVPHNGGEVYAEVGRGHYIYTSYAWFRQLPAGVPGAYRLFANLLSLPKAPQASGGRRAAKP
jgi:hypothetical protein